MSCRRSGTLAAMLAALLAWTATAVAAQPAAEVTRLGEVEITRHMHGFLSDEERALLELVATNPMALEVMMGEGAGHAAMAVAPAEGLVRDGLPSGSAHAVARLPDAASARAEALAGCEAARQAGPACVLVLEVAPLR